MWRRTLTVMIVMAIAFGIVIFNLVRLQLVDGKS